MILALDTATRYAGVALYDGESLLLETNWRSEQSHTQELMPIIVAGLARLGMTAHDLQGLAVSLGPGSFTGLRIGMSVAKGIALVTGRPILGIPTLDILGYAHARDDMPTMAIVEAGRGRLCVATYRGRPQSWHRLDEYRLVSPEELVDGVEVPTFFCGEIAPTLRELLQRERGALAHLASPAASLRRAGYLAELGWQRLQRGERDDLTTLSPIYLHPTGQRVIS